MEQIFLKPKKEKYWGDGKTPQITPQDIRNFLNELIEEGEIKAFYVSERKEIIREKTEEKIVITIERGVTFYSVNNINEEHREYLIKSCKKPSSYYLLSIKSQDGYYSGEARAICHKYKFKKLSPEFDVRNLRKRRGLESPDEIIAPKEAVCAEIIVRYNLYSEVFNLYPWYVYLSKEGEKDKLLEGFISFIEKEISIIA